jgi:hypothetical protein
MQECRRCATMVPNERRSCPICGNIVHPEAVDPPVQDQQRSTTTIANLRSDNETLRAAIERADQERTAAEQESNELREALALISLEHQGTMEEARDLKRLLEDLIERSRLLRAFEASQVQLFPAGFSEAEPGEENAG